MTRSWMVAVLLVLFSAAYGFAQKRVNVIPHHQDQPPGPALSPGEAVRKMTVPEGFSVEVVAAEPDVINPVAMTIDERDRFWITESIEYPRRSPGKGRDRIKVLEDTNGDGKADKATIFAEGLNIPSGIAVGHGGVWVANSPDVLFLQDTNGDGKADKQEVVVTGFGRRDTHELPNSFTWGPDGWLYGLNGVFNPAHVRYPPSSPHYRKDHPGFKFTCAMFRIHPKTREFQVFAEGTSNPWGITWDSQGSAFISACVIDHLWHITETGYYHRQGGPYPPHTWKSESIVKHKHQKAAYCGIDYFDSDAYPKQYRERLYMGNIHGGCINVDVLRRDGSTYFATPNPDFLTANDAWFMPVVQKTGPDGCLYVLDWYDRYHCYQDANRDPKGIDRLKGRLYRVRYKNTPRVFGFNLAEETDAQLISRLSSPNIYFRQTAQLILQERNNPDTRRTLQQIVLEENTPQKTKLHALWSLLGTDDLETDFHLKLLSNNDTSLRAWGVRVAGDSGHVSSDLKRRLLELASDSAPDVRLQWAIAAGKIDSISALPVWVEILSHSGNDKLIPHIVWQNLYPLLENQSGQLIQIVRDKRANSPALSAMMPRVLDRMLAKRDGGMQSVVSLIEILAGGANADVDAAGPCLSILASRIQSREISGEKLKTLKSGLQTVIGNILSQKPNAPLYSQAAFLATGWNDPAGIKAVRKVLVLSQQNPRDRLAALNALVAVKDASLLPAVNTILSHPNQTSTTFRRQVITSLGRLNNNNVAIVLLSNYSRMEPELKPQVIELLTQRTSWSKQLLASIEKKQIPAASLNLNQVRRLQASRDQELVKQVRLQWGTIREKRDPNREKLIVEMKQFIRKNPGDPHEGTKVFKKVCCQCHKMYGEGVEVGPDITLNGRNSFDQLLSNVFDSSLVIGASYRAHTVVTTDGRVLTGLLVEDNKQRIVLKVQGGKLETIARKDIEISKAGEISMMPKQLEKQIKPNELADLFAYLVLDRPPSDPNARMLPGVREITPRTSRDTREFPSILAEVAPGFSTSAVGGDGLALLKEHMGRSTVVRTRPLNRIRPCVLRGTFKIPTGKKSRLALSVAHHPGCDWQLIVIVNGKRMLDTLIGAKTTNKGWAEHTVDLSICRASQVSKSKLNCTIIPTTGVANTAIGAALRLSHSDIYNPRRAGGVSPLMKQPAG